MSLVFNNIDPLKPQTHVFLIGIGGYRYLKNGLNAKKQDLDIANDLDQLTSPSASIELMYRSIIEFHNENSWNTDLGSIEILLSPAPNAKIKLQHVKIDRASHDNIVTSYFEWKKRCNTNKKNVALFFFCGHGAEKEHHYLLAEDFGEVPSNPWIHSFNFDLTRIGFNSCIAETQLFFVDACRQITHDMLEQHLLVSPIDNPGHMNTNRTYNFTLKATALNGGAQGMKDQPSYFTKALVNGLKGQVARKNGRYWTIETSDICSNIYSLMDLVKPGQSEKQACQFSFGKSAEILKHTNVPEVSLEVCCDPDEALSHAHLNCISQQTRQKVSRTPQANPWKLNVKAGFYNLSAKFKNKKFQNSSTTTSAMPPIKKEILICQ